MLPSCARRLPPDPHGEDAPSRSVLGKHPRDGDAVEPPDAHKAPKQAKQANEPLIRETQQYGDKEQVEQDQEAGGAAQPADCSPGGLENDAGASAEGFEAPEGTNQKAEGSGQNGKEGSHVILERREQKAKDASGSSRMEKGKAAKENEAPGAAAKAMTPEVKSLAKLLLLLRLLDAPSMAEAMPRNRWRNGRGKRSRERPLC